MALGPNDLKNVSLPAKIDAAELSRLVLRDGTSVEAVLRDIDGAFGLVNTGLTSSWLSRMTGFTTDPYVEYGVGVSNGFEEMTEHALPDAKRAATTGHMLPIKNYDRKFGWTKLFLEEARRVQIDEDIASGVQDVVDLYEKKVLTRLFKSTADTGASNGVGANGSSVPFADGGTADSTFVPKARADRGGTFLYTHTHYLRLDGITQANIETAVNHVWEHGHDAPFVILASNADVASWLNATNVTGLAKAITPGVQVASTATVANVPDGYLAIITTNRGPAYLMLSGRIPTGYWAVMKSYGASDQRNPLRVRYDDMFGLGVKLESDIVGANPLVGAYARVKFGVGVGADRTSAVLVYNSNSGSYSDPTIS